MLKSSSVTTTSGITVADMRANIQSLGYGATKNLGVTIGGKVFSPTYVSKDRSGNVIVTMWLNVYDSAEGVQQYNTYKDCGSAYTYPSNMYSSSYLRSYITGSYYATSGSSAPSRVSTTQWQTFGSNFSSYIVTPNQVEWQKNASSYSVLGYGSYPAPNEGWGHTYVCNNDYRNCGSTSNGTNYFAWGADKLWIPSTAETGYSNDKNGIWKTNGKLRVNGKATWNRSGGATSVSYAWGLTADGTAMLADSNKLVTKKRAVRPAFHLNLTKAVKDAGMLTATPKWSDNTTANKSYAYDGATKSATYYSLPTGVSVSASGGTHNTGTRTISASSMGTYTLTFSLATGYVWTDNTTSNKTLSLVIGKANITNIKVTAYSGTYDGKAHNAIASYSCTTVNNQAKTWYWSTTSATTGFSTTMPKVTNYTAGTTIWYYVSAPNHNNSAVGSVSAKVNKRNLTVVWDYTGATNTGTHTYTYNGGEQGPTATYSNLVSGQNYKPTVTYKGTNNLGEAFDRTGKVIGAGSNYKASVSNAAPTTNYTVTASEVTWQINKAVITGLSYASLEFTYTGEVQCPVINGFTTATSVAAHPFSIFNLTGGQTDAGNHVVTATLTASAACNFTTSSSDVNATQIKTNYTIHKAALLLSLDPELLLIYNGLGQQCGVELIVPETVIASVRPELSDLIQEVTAKLGSHLTNGEAVDVGEYILTIKLPKNLSKNFTLSETSQTATSVTLDFEIVKAAIGMSWTWTGSKPYNSEKQGPAIKEFTGVPEHGEDPLNGVTVTYYGANGQKLSGAPVHAGKYKVTVTLQDGNYGFLKMYIPGGTTLTEPSKSVDFEITAVKYSGAFAWDEAEDLVFTGKGQGPVINQAYYGVYAGDSSRELEITVEYAEYMPDGTLSARTSDKYVNAGRYAVYATESYGDYLFDVSDFEIGKRSVTVNWLGDGKSEDISGVMTWMYDGLKHKPEYSVDFGGAEIYRDGEKIDTLKITYADITNVGTGSAVAVLAEDKDAYGKDYNLNFEISDATLEQALEVVKLVVERVDWYERGASEALSEDALEGLWYEYTRVYGKDGPHLRAKGVGNFNGREVTLDLVVEYPDAQEKYWWYGVEQDYDAVAKFASKDILNAEYKKEIINYEDRYVSIVFTVTNIQSDLIVVEVTWGVYVNGVFMDINELEAYIGTLTAEQAAELGIKVVDGVIVYTYDGKSHSPAAVGKVVGSGLTVKVTVSAKSAKVNAGKYVAYLEPSSEYEIHASESEIGYEIAAREIRVGWSGAESYEYDGAEHKRIAQVTEGSLLDGDRLVVSVDGVNAGRHEVTAKVYSGSAENKNYRIVEGAVSEIMITRKKIAVGDVVWSCDELGEEAFDNSGKKYYVWTADGKNHAPEAKLGVTVKLDGENDETVNLKIIVVGEASEVGVYTAYAMLDGSDRYNDNFMLVQTTETTNPVAAIAEQKYEIVRITIVSIDWYAERGGEKTENISYEYDGAEHKPYAIGVTDGGAEIELNVWGGEINAGSYKAYVTDEYGFGGVEKSVSYEITPKELKVEWTDGEYAEGGVYTYNGITQHPNAEVKGLDASEYSVTGYVNAGEYVSKVIISNKNYKVGADGECKFTIERRALKVSWGASGNEPTEDGALKWSYDGSKGERGPVASASWESMSFGENSANRIIVSGRAKAVGKYEAVAQLDYSVAENTNFKLENAVKSYEIIPYTITVNWIGNEDAEPDSELYGAFAWEYDGAQHAPRAKYMLWDGEHEAEISGARSNAGTGYIAYVKLPSNCVFNEIGGKSVGEKSFEIRKKVVENIVWYDKEYEDYSTAQAITDKNGEYFYEYDGKSHMPGAVVEGITGEAGKLVVTGVRINAGTGYKAVAALKDSSNYELGANANLEYEFGISEKTVWIKWLGENGSLTDFEWEYSGGFICPTAVLCDKDGNKIGLDGEITSGDGISVTVTGGKITAGTYVAEAHDTFGNFVFAEQGNSVTRRYTIKPISLGNDFEWTYDSTNCTKTEADGVTVLTDTYEYEYNGKTQQPLAKSGLVKFAYAITNAKGEAVHAIINVGEYTVRITSSDKSYTIPNAEIKVIITAKEVNAIWSGLTLEYNGKAQKPSAYYKDVNGQSVALEVEGEQTAAGSYTATAKLAKGNYVLVAGADETAADDGVTISLERAFEITAKTTVDVVWDSENGKWVDKNSGSEITPPPAQTAARAVEEEIADSKAAEAVEEVYGVQTHTALLPKAVKADTTQYVAETERKNRKTAECVNPLKQHYEPAKKRLNSFLDI